MNQPSAKCASRNRRILFVAAGLSIGLAPALLALELAVRVLSNEGQSLLVKDDEIGQRYRRRFEGEKFVPEAKRFVQLRFNSSGFRGPEIPDRAPTQVRRVAVLGDSFVAAIGVAEADMMTARLSMELNATKSGAKYEILNFGVSGFGTAQELLAWRHVVRIVHPDLVVLCFYNGNDLSDNCERLSTANRPYFTLASTGELELHPMSGSRSAGSRWLAEHSQFYVWQRNQMRIARDRVREWSGRLPPGFQIFRRDPPEPFAEAWRLTEKLLATIKSEVEADGATLLVVQIPCHEQIYERDWRQLQVTVGNDRGQFDVEYPENHIAEICNRHGIRRLSLLAALKEATSKGELFFAGNGHWNELGNQVAAQAIADAISRLTNEPIAQKPVAGQPLN